METLKYDEIYMGNYETYLDVVDLPYFIGEVYKGDGNDRPRFAL